MLDYFTHGEGAMLLALSLPLLAALALIYYEIQTAHDYAAFQEALRAYRVRNGIEAPLPNDEDPGDGLLPRVGPAQPAD